MLDLAERQVERLDAVGWHFALKLAATATVLNDVTSNLLGVVFTAGVRDWARPLGFVVLFGTIAWGLNRDRLARTRAERRALSRAVLAAHELLPLLTTILSPMEEQEIRLRLSRLPFDDEAEPKTSAAPPKPARQNAEPADARPPSPSTAH